MTTIPNKSKYVKHKCYPVNWQPMPSGTKSILRLKKFLQKNIHFSKTNPHENRAWNALVEMFGCGWERQVFFGRRMFDFFHFEKGVILEIDGDDHCKVCDQRRDARLLDEYGLVTIRLPNHFSMNQMDTMWVFMRNRIHERKREKFLKAFKRLNDPSLRADLFIQKRKEKGQKENKDKKYHQKFDQNKKKIKKILQGQNSKLPIVRETPNGNLIPYFSPCKENPYTTIPSKKPVREILTKAVIRVRNGTRERIVK